MTLLKRPNSQYWYVQFQINHKTHIRSTRVSDKKTAEKIALKIRQEAASEIFLGKSKSITLQDALDSWIKTKKGQANEKNLRGYRNAILRLIGGNRLLTEITSSTLEDFKAARMNEGIAAQTIKHAINCIMGAIKLAKRNGFSVCDIEAPTVRITNSRLRYLSNDEEQKLLFVLNPQNHPFAIAVTHPTYIEQKRHIQDNYDLVLILMDTGARYSEIANLKWEQINITDKTINLWRSKVSNESVIFMSERIYDVLQRRFNEKHTPFIFNNKAGNARGYCAKSIRKSFKRAGLHDCNIHTLRHTHATRLIQAGLSLYEVKAVLGHTDIKTTMRYAHLEEKAVTAKARDMINFINSRASKPIG